MLNSVQLFLSISTVLIPSILAFAKIKFIDRRYLPFIFLLCVGTINESVSTYIFLFTNYFSFYCYNTFVLAEALLVFWQFCNWKLIKSKQTIIIYILLVVGIWVSECFFYMQFEKECFISIIIFSFLLSILAIKNSYKTLFIDKGRGDILIKPSFVINCAFIAYYPYSSITEVVRLYGRYYNDGLENFAIYIHFYVGISINLVYIIAVLLLIREKRIYANAPIISKNRLTY